MNHMTTSSFISCGHQKAKSWQRGVYHYSVKTVLSPHYSTKGCLLCGCPWKGALGFSLPPLLSSHGCQTRARSQETTRLSDSIFIFPESLKDHITKDYRTELDTVFLCSHTTATSAANFHDSKRCGSFSSPAIKQFPSRSHFMSSNVTSSFWRQQNIPWGRAQSPELFLTSSLSLASSRLVYPHSD